MGKPFRKKGKHLRVFLATGFDEEKVSFNCRDIRIKTRKGRYENKNFVAKIDFYLHIYF